MCHLYVLIRQKMTKGSGGFYFVLSEKKGRARDVAQWAEGLHGALDLISSTEQTRSCSIQYQSQYWGHSGRRMRSS